SVKFTNVECQSQNLSWVVMHHCRLKAINRNRVDFNFNSTILYPVYNLSVRTQLFKKANGYKPWLIDVSVDVCLFLRRNNHPFVKIVYDIFRPSSNINHTCPYVVSRKQNAIFISNDNIYSQGPIIVAGLHLKPNSIPLPLPTGDYCLVIKWKFDRRLQAISKFYFEYIE
ncbi:hypothetical protein KR044_008547, partial [Drosophila immigrans]